MDAYFDKYLDPPLTSVDITQICSTEMEELSNIRDQVLTLLKTADKVAAMVRVKVRKHMNELAEQEQK